MSGVGGTISRICSGVPYWAAGTLLVRDNHTLSVKFGSRCTLQSQARLSLHTAQHMIANIESALDVSF